MDATHAAHIYGEGHGDSGMVPPPGTRPVDQHWSLNEAREYGAPPSTSSFSTLSEEGFQSDGYQDGEDLGDFLGPLMGTGGGGGGAGLLEGEWGL